MLEDYNYELPEELIRQTPLAKRDASRLFVLHRNGGNEDKHFYDIIDYLHPGDVLVLNNTKVIPARLIGVKEETNAVIELLLLKDQGEDVWECLARPARRIKVGTVVQFGDGLLRAECVQEKEDGIRLMRLLYSGILLEILEKLGTMPLPPYIHEKLKDANRYQTVYAKTPGSAAAPTAGLHFTKELLAKIQDKGIKIAYITLHVGLGTFRPVAVQNIKEHHMHTEYYEMSQEVADLLNHTRETGGRIIAVGTTSVRTLETIRCDHDKFVATSGWTDIFIYPGFVFQGTDALITNFHLPKSTLLMLISAFAGRERVLDAYREAVEKKYYFFSFGDSMFIE